MIERKKDVTLGCIDFYTPLLTYNMLRSFWIYHKDSINQMPLCLVDNTQTEVTEKFLEQQKIPFINRK